MDRVGDGGLGKSRCDAPTATAVWGLEMVPTTRVTVLVAAVTGASHRMPGEASSEHLPAHRVDGVRGVGGRQIHA